MTVPLLMSTRKKKKKSRHKLMLYHMKTDEGIGRREESNLSFYNIYLRKIDGRALKIEERMGRREEQLIPFLLKFHCLQSMNYRAQKS